MTAYLGWWLFVKVVAFGIFGEMWEGDRTLTKALSDEFGIREEGAIASAKIE